MEMEINGLKFSSDARRKHDIGRVFFVPNNRTRRPGKRQQPREEQEKEKKEKKRQGQP